MFVPEGAESFDWAAVVTREQEKVQKLAARVSRLGRFEAEEDCRRGVKNHIPPEKVRRGVMGGRGRCEEFAEAGGGEESRCTRSPDDLPGERLPTGRGETVPEKKEKRECDDTPGRRPGGGRPRHVRRTTVLHIFASFYSHHLVTFREIFCEMISVFQGEREKHQVGKILLLIFFDSD